MKYSGYRKLLCELSKLSKFNALTSSDTKQTRIHYSCLQISPRENWFQYVRRVYATAINFPCIITLHCSIQCIRIIPHKSPHRFGSYFKKETQYNHGNIL